MKDEFSKRSRPAWQACIALLAVMLASLACISIPNIEFGSPEQATVAPRQPQENPGQVATQEVIPTLTLAPSVIEAQDTPTPPAAGEPTPTAEEAAAAPENSVSNGVLPQTGQELNTLFHRVNPAVVSIQVYGGQGINPVSTGSGFIIDELGHVVTNRHVVAAGTMSTVVFNNGVEVRAELIGMDADSDLAVLRVESHPEGVEPLLLGDSDTVVVGESVMAIGNPFGLAGTMTMGVISAVGRDIPTGVTPFTIPQAIQTDAAINPGNSGGPLLNMRGEVIGVNAQIATSGVGIGNVGVGFAIPSNTVRRVVPVLIETGTYQWSWLGVSGSGVNLAVQLANNLPTQNGAYVDSVTGGSPADRAGLRGSTSATQVQGFGSVRTGGDVIIAADGEPIISFSDLLVAITSHMPGEIMQLTILRNGAEMQIDVEMGARPNNINQNPSLLPGVTPDQPLPPGHP
jgi:S1-C subfamily serine protease